MAGTFKPGDRVQWNTSQGKTRGRVKKKLTSPASIKGHIVRASKQNPEYLVQSDKTGKAAAHKPAGLKKLGKRTKTGARRRKRGRS
jgi:hypothetical protein